MAKKIDPYLRWERIQERHIGPRKAQKKPPPLYEWQEFKMYDPWGNLVMDFGGTWKKVRNATEHGVKTVVIDELSDFKLVPKGMTGKGYRRQIKAEKKAARLAERELKRQAKVFIQTIEAIDAPCAWL